MKARGDRSRKVGTSKQSKGPAATSSSMVTNAAWKAPYPGSKRAGAQFPGGDTAYHQRGKPKT
jgi:hypothetical protein